MKKNTAAALSALFVLSFFIIMRHALRPEEARIRKTLKSIESILSKQPDEPLASGLIRANRAAEYFSEDCYVRVNGQVIRGKAELPAVIYQARQSSSAIRISLRDVQITLIDENKAKVLLTAYLSADGPFIDSTAAEVEIDMAKLEGAWKIQKLQTVDVLR